MIELICNKCFVINVLFYSLEFDIIPIEDSVCNKSPVIHVEHRLGLESWCVRHLYQYIYHKFIDSRISNNRTGISLKLSHILIGLLELNTSSKVTTQ